MLYISVDVETSGPYPGLFSLLSIGAVPLTQGPNGRFGVDETQGFYVELQHLEGASELDSATTTHGLTRAHLNEHGVEPKAAMRRFEVWVDELSARYGRVHAAAWPVTFDITFVSWYAMKFLNRKMFLFTAFDIGTFAQGVFRGEPGDVSRRMATAGYHPPPNPRPHHALSDAVEQGHTLAWVLNYAYSNNKTQIIARPSNPLDGLKNIKRV